MCNTFDEYWNRRLEEGHVDCSSPFFRIKIGAVKKRKFAAFVTVLLVLFF